jgi:hypothetical protein
LQDQFQPEEARSGAPGQGRLMTPIPAEMGHYEKNTRSQYYSHFPTSYTAEIQEGLNLITYPLHVRGGEEVRSCRDPDEKSRDFEQTMIKLRDNSETSNGQNRL